MVKYKCDTCGLDRNTINQCVPKGWGDIEFRVRLKPNGQTEGCEEQGFVRSEHKLSSSWLISLCNECVSVFKDTGFSLDIESFRAYSKLSFQKVLEMKTTIDRCCICPRCSVMATRSRNSNQDYFYECNECGARGPIEKTEIDAINSWREVFKKGEMG